MNFVKSLLLSVLIHQTSTWVLNRSPQMSDSRRLVDNAFPKTKSVLSQFYAQQQLSDINPSNRQELFRKVEESSQLWRNPTVDDQTPLYTQFVPPTWISSPLWIPSWIKTSFPTLALANGLQREVSNMNLGDRCNELKSNLSCPNINSMKNQQFSDTIEKNEFTKDVNVESADVSLVTQLLDDLDATILTSTDIEKSNPSDDLKTESPVYDNIPFLDLTQSLDNEAMQQVTNDSSALDEDQTLINLTPKDDIRLFKSPTTESILNTEGILSENSEDYKTQVTEDIANNPQAEKDIENVTQFTKEDVILYPAAPITEILEESVNLFETPLTTEGYPVTTMIEVTTLDEKLTNYDIESLTKESLSLQVNAEKLSNEPKTPAETSDLEDGFTSLNNQPTEGENTFSLDATPLVITGPAEDIQTDDQFTTEEVILSPTMDTEILKDTFYDNEPTSGPNEMLSAIQYSIFPEMLENKPLKEEGEEATGLENSKQVFETQLSRDDLSAKTIRSEIFEENPTIPEAQSDLPIKESDPELESSDKNATYFEQSALDATRETGVIFNISPAEIVENMPIGKDVDLDPSEQVVETQLPGDDLSATAVKSETLEENTTILGTQDDLPIMESDTELKSSDKNAAYFEQSGTASDATIETGDIFNIGTAEIVENMPIGKGVDLDPSEKVVETQLPGDGLTATTVKSETLEENTTILETQDDLPIRGSDTELESSDKNAAYFEQSGAASDATKETGDISNIGTAEMEGKGVDLVNLEPSDQVLKTQFSTDNFYPTAVWTFDDISLSETESRSGEKIIGTSTQTGYEEIGTSQAPLFTFQPVLEEESLSTFPPVLFRSGSSSQSGIEIQETPTTDLTAAKEAEEVTTYDASQTTLEDGSFTTVDGNSFSQSELLNMQQPTLDAPASAVKISEVLYMDEVKQADTLNPDDDSRPKPNLEGPESIITPADSPLKEDSPDDLSVTVKYETIEKEVSGVSFTTSPLTTAFDADIELVQRVARTNANINVTPTTTLFSETENDSYDDESESMSYEDK